MTLGVLLSFAIAILIGARLIRQARQERAALHDETPRQRKTELIESLSSISITAGVLAILTYMTTIGLGPRWLHTASLPSAVALIAGGYALAAVAGWRKGGKERR